MAVSTIHQVGRLLRGREVQFRAVVITALASYLAQLIGILLHWPLWAIALATILPLDTTFLHEGVMDEQTLWIHGSVSRNYDSASGARR
jgi:hypothetical protein